MAPRSDGASSAAFPATDDSASANDRDVFRLFAYLWAAAVLFHIGSFDLWSQSWLEVLAAFWVLTRPGSTLALSVLMALHLQATLPVTPRTANHALFASAISGSSGKRRRTASTSAMSRPGLILILTRR